MLSFYEELSVVKTNKAFIGDAMTSKSSVKDFLNDLLDETKGFKYQITVEILLKKYKVNEIEFSPV